MSKTAKKKTAKKSSEEKSETGIKYSDKSIGQPELVHVFNELKALIVPYEKGHLKARKAAGQYHLISDKEVEVAAESETIFILQVYLCKKPM